ncbi:hypothetical protein GO755_38170 [Spirosoma sp. HMF4905]|uniref:Uncharacterized protein n=1 Tax=Spirosoma arboris TaxID=2682092 RepID=A0A7K1SQD1_9BACT|nr:hypothetical protein [Spirosoma arboris]MVM35903.1 hypothetical protein [Spirosoma arboris]
MKIGFNLCRLSVFLLLLCVMTSYGQVLPTRLPVITNEGEVVLATGVRLWRQLSYQPLTNTLMVQQANSWHTYQADQLRHFSYTDRADDRTHYIKAFAVQLASGETRTMLLEELIPGAPIPLLQLPSSNGQHGTIIQGLPQPRTANWKTEQPYYVWFDGRLLAPDVFVRTEIDALLTTVPESVQYWAAAYPRPTSLPELMEWLSYLERELSLGQLKPARTQPKPVTTPASTPFTLY